MTLGLFRVELTDLCKVVANNEVLDLGDRQVEIHACGRIVRWPWARAENAVNKFQVRRKPALVAAALHRTFCVENAVTKFQARRNRALAAVAAVRT